MKLCIDCKHFYEEDDIAMCDIPQEQGVLAHELIYGKNYTRWRDEPCHEHRRCDLKDCSHCGEQGRFWEPKDEN